LHRKSPSLEEAIALAATAHAGQKDMAGEPYILHPLRVMLSLRTQEERLAAILHDTVEDTSITLKKLRSLGYSERVIAAIDALSRRDDETYEEFTERVAKNPLAVRVKLADIADNLMRSRRPPVSAADKERIRRYLKA
jgi:(p)ppGpp synthase/HD superfamily hydrolase